MLPTSIDVADYNDVVTTVDVHVAEGFARFCRDRFAIIIGFLHFSEDTIVGYLHMSENDCVLHMLEDAS